MSQIEKAIQKLKNSKTAVRLQLIEKVLFNFGYKKVRQRGSHLVYYQSISNLSIRIVVHNNLVKIVYVKDIIKALNL